MINLANDFIGRTRIEPAGGHASILRPARDIPTRGILTVARVIPAIAVDVLVPVRLEITGHIEVITDLLGDGAAIEVRLERTVVGTGGRPVPGPRNFRMIDLEWD